jgi:hypothetical protein
MYIQHINVEVSVQKKRAIPRTPAAQEGLLLIAGVKALLRA